MPEKYNPFGLDAYLLQGSNQKYALLSNSYQVFFHVGQKGYKFVDGRPDWDPFEDAESVPVVTANKNIVSFLWSVLSF